MHKNQSRNVVGFTLIELMIVVAIIAIIAAVGYPSYTSYVIRAKRSEGRSALLDGAARLERYYSDNNVYATAANTIVAGVGISSPTENGYYTITLTTATPFQTFVLNATPVVPFVDAGCGVLTLSSAGVKGEGGTADAATCWGG